MSAPDALSPALRERVERLLWHSERVPLSPIEVRVAIECLALDLQAAREAAEHERSRVKLSLVYPNWPTVFPWEAPNAR